MVNERILHLMKRMLLIAVVTLASLALVYGQTARISKSERIKRDLMQLERDIGKANIESNYAFFDRVEAH